MSINLTPTFLCIGVQKAGTSWLYEMISQHPDVCVSVPKELHFFNRSPNYNKGLEWYLSHFSNHHNAKAIGEFTPDYFWGLEEHDPKLTMAENPNVAQRIAEVFPDIQLLIVLRNPVDRAVSSYYHQIGAGRLSPRQRLGEVDDFWGIVSMGHYAEHLERWFEYFPKENFNISVYEEDFSTDNKMATLRAIFKHIKVDPTFEPSGLNDRYNKRRSHFDYRLSRLPGRIQKLARKFTPDFIENSRIWNIPVKQEEIEHLRQYYRPHNENLEKILGRKLPW